VIVIDLEGASDEGLRNDVLCSDNYLGGNIARRNESAFHAGRNNHIDTLQNVPGETWHFAVCALSWVSSGLI
jgi:hypothetical protein